MLLLAACTIDQQVENTDKPHFDSAEPADTDTAPPPTEECNGVDDDGDGAIDEDFPDDDDNGRADCLDVECPALTLSAAGPVDLDDTCPDGIIEVVEDFAAMRTLWSYTPPDANPGPAGSLAMPAVARLTDTNGDGRIDAQDPASVLLVSSTGLLHVLDAATGSLQWSKEGFGNYPSVVVADIDADGSPDIVTGDTARHLQALEADGTEKWTSSVTFDASDYRTPLIADLEGDGQPEVVIDDQVLDGADGGVRFELDLPPTSVGYRLPAVADVDADGQQEILLDGALFNADGSERWDSAFTSFYGSFPLVVQADEDDEPELVFAGETLDVYEPDGTLRVSVDLSAEHSYVGVPCAGDFDGDGAMELALPRSTQLSVFELDGTERWSVPIQDTSGLSGCSGADLDGDGALEVLYAGEVEFGVYDGATGTQLLSDTTHYSNTLYDYPVVADVDGDEHAEIVVVQNKSGEEPAVVVWRHDGPGWAPTGRTWAVHDFGGTNIGEDGAVPSTPPTPWLDPGVYRARPAEASTALPELQARIEDICVADCDYGPVMVGVAVENAGNADAAAGVELRLYAVDGEAERLVATEILPELPAGQRADGVTFHLEASDIGSSGWAVTIDEPDVVEECDEGDDKDRWEEVFCP